MTSSAGRNTAAGHSEPEKPSSSTFSGGIGESVGMLPKQGGQAGSEKTDIERMVDGPMPDLSRLDEKDEFIQSQPLMVLIHDAFIQQKEDVLNLLGRWLLIALPAIINIHRSWPFLKRTWMGIYLCENVLGQYADFVLAVLLVGFSSALYSILFARVLEMRDSKFLILLFVLLGISFMVQESIMVGWATLLKSLEMD